MHSINGTFLLRPMFEKKSFQPHRNSYMILQAAILGLFFIFVTRFWYLQVFKGAEYAERAKENRTRVHSIYAPRGLLRDRSGILLAENEPAYALALVREDSADIERALDQVSRWTEISPEVLRADFERGRRRIKSFEPQILVPNLSFELVARIESEAYNWPELKIVSRPRRTYPYGAVLAHIIGYVAQANEEELNADSRLSLGDNVGKQGLELVLENRLRGHKGARQFEVDAVGRRLNEKELRSPEAGENIKLSIDYGLQERITNLLNGQAGSVVVLEPNTGKVLALVSEPSFDSNLFVEGISRKDWEALLKDPLHPLQNRSIQSAYPPGSVFKLAMAACALSENAVDPSETVTCYGKYRLGNREFRCWKKHGHGKVDMERALIESCDVYFYKLGETLGVDVISAYARECGFGVKTGVELPHERSGLIPDREWKRRRFGVSWQGGETLNMSIGQGYTLSTPIQVARYIAALVNEGELFKPTLLADVDAEVVGNLPLSEQHREMILETMVDTVEDSRGTGRRLKTEGLRIGAKTGTAQVVKLMEEFEDKETDEIPYKYRDHAWIATFGESSKHSYVVVVMVEHGGHGGATAGPIAKGVYDYLFKDVIEAGS